MQKNHKNLIYEIVSETKYTVQEKLYTTLKQTVY